ncbi:MAG: hypothetical protein MR430_10925 [Lachnospiraceae bacterium]|nr:hypothetical protein [Lachnospiraceae bacterium]
MATVVDEKRMDIVLPQGEKAMAVEVMDFISELSQGEQRDFMNFLQGAKFVMTLGKTSALRTI